MSNKSNWINFIILVVIVIFVTLLSQSFFTRLDFSKGKVYTLSKASKHSVENLDDIMVVKAYFSKSLPAEYADNRRFTQDLLDEYQAYSGGKLRYEFVDPKGEDDLKKEAENNQITPKRKQVIEDDQVAIRDIYMGLAFLYQDKVEAIPFIENTQGLEYYITQAVKKISAQKMKQVAFYTSDNELVKVREGQAYPYQTIRQMISGSYELSDNDLTKPLTADISALIISGVADTLAEEQLYNLDQYIMQGGKVLIFQDRVKVNYQNRPASVYESNLFDLLESYGIVAKKNLVEDSDCITGEVDVPMRKNNTFTIEQVIYKLPFFMNVENKNTDNVIVKKIDKAMMYFVSEIDTTLVINDFTPLFYSSNHSAQTTGPPFDMSNYQYIENDQKPLFTEGRKTLAGMYSGSFHSYFEGNSAYPDVITSTENAQVIFVPCGSFIREDATGKWSGNQIFALNAVDYLAGDQDLIEIRSKGTELRPLNKPESKTTRQLVKWLNILFPSILLILIGIFRWRRESSRKIRIGDLYE